MRIGDSDASPDGLSECASSSGDDVRSPYALAQDGLAELIEASVQAQRVEAMNAAVRVDLIFLTLSYALRSEEAFTAPTLSPQPDRPTLIRGSPSAASAVRRRVSSPLLTRSAAP